MVTARPVAALAALALLPLVAAPARAGETLYVEAGLVVPVSGEPIPKGRIVIRDGRVAEVGAAVERPAFSRFVDARGLTVTPGFVVPMSTLGMPSGTATEPGTVTMSPETKASDEIYPLRPEFALVLQHGVTTLGVLPAATGVGILGQSVAVSPRVASPKSMAVRDEAAIVLVAAAHGTFRGTLRDAFEKADEALAKEDRSAQRPAAGGNAARRSLDTTRQAASHARARAARADSKGPKTEKGEAGRGRKGQRSEAGKGTREPPGDSGGSSGGKSAKEGAAKGGKDAAAKKDPPAERSKDPLVRLLRRQQPALVAASTTGSWTTVRDAVPLERMDVTVVDGWRFHEIAPQMKELGVRVVTWPALSRLPHTRQPLNRAAAYERAGVPYAFALASDSVRGAASLRDDLIAMARTGCSREKALAAATREAALALGVEDLVGSIQAGRRADLLFWTGDPFDPTTRLDAVMSAGEFIPRAPGLEAKP